MPDYRGKCASCGVRKFCKNFAGFRAGRLIPDPCHVALRPGRSPKDDRLCTQCYKAHLAKEKSAAPPAATPPSTRRRSSTSSLDGVQWSETASDRVAKVVHRDSSGEPVIPLALHEKKMEEQAKALRRESLNVWEARAAVRDAAGAVRGGGIFSAPRRFLQGTTHVYLIPLSH
jgi:hypothetical protein